MSKINLNFTIEIKDNKEIVKLQDKELLNEVAKEWADKIERGTKKTQVRNFYDKVLELENEIKENDFESVYPFIKMLNSKVAYGVSRKVVSKEFENMFNECLKQIELNDKGEQTFKNFKLFFEAVVGFYKGRD